MALDQESEQMLIDKYSTTNPLGQVMQVAKHLPQDQASKILRYSTLSGDAPQIVANNLHAYESDIVDKIDWDDVMTQAPKTSAFLQDPLNMAVTKTPDNVNALTNMEKITGSFWEGTKDVARSILNWKVGKEEFRKSLEDRYLSTLPEDTRNKILSSYGQGEGQIQEYKQMADSDALKPRNIKADTTLGQYGLDFVRTVPQIAAQAGTALAAGPQTSAAFMFTQIAGGQYDDLRKEGVDPERAFYASLANAAMQTPLEYIGLSKVMSKLPGGKTFTKDLIERAATEGLTEWAQQYPEEFTNIAAKNKDGGIPEWSKKFADNFWEITKEGAYQGLVAAPFGVLGGIGRKLQQRQAEAFVRRQEAIQNAIAQSAVTKVSPELMENFTDHVTDGEKVYIDPAALTSFNQSSLDKLGISQENVQEALDHGNMIEVPAGKYDVAAVQHPEIHAALKDDISADVDGLTPRRIAEQTQEEVAAVQSEAQAKNEELKLETDKVYQNLREAGASEQEAKLVTVGLAANARVMRPENPAQYLRDNAPLYRRGHVAETGKLEKLKNKFYQFAGMSAKTANIDSLSQAKNLDVKGIKNEEIRRKTGWFKGADKKWRFEIDDSKAKLIDGKAISSSLKTRISGLLSQAKKVKDTTEKQQLESQADTLISELSRKSFYSLENILDHPDLYQAYPWLKDMKVLFGNMKENVRGAYNPGNNTIEINQALSEEEKKKTLLHEIQHVIQKQEGYARGGDPNQVHKVLPNQYKEEVEKLTASMKAEQNGWGSVSSTTTDNIPGTAAMNVYHRLAGEIEARDTANRSDLTAEQRVTDAPNIPSDAIVVYNGQEYSYRQPVPEGTPRGQIDFMENGRAVITLFEHSDPSTVIHETVGHYFVNNLLEKGSAEDAPEWMKQDRQAALDFAGITDWTTATEEQKKAAHEKLASAAEAYIMEGKAPSLETRSMFRRFAEWLTDIYHTIKNLGVELNPEIRGVFDRLLATQEEITQMEALGGYMDRIPPNIYDTLTEGQKAELEKLLANTQERAESQVRAHLMLQYTEENKNKITAEENTARERITAEVMAEPLHVAGKTVSETFGKDAKKIAKAYLKDTPAAAGFNGMEKVKPLPQDQQLEFEYIAEANGFSSGSELAQHILSYNDAKTTIANRLEDHMMKFKENINDTEAVHKDIEEAMYSDEGALLIAAQQQLIDEQLHKVLTKEESRKAAHARRELARQAAEDTIAKMPVEQVMKLHTWISAERRAAEKKTAALKRGDLEAAQNQSSIQLYNHMMVQNSIYVRREMEKIDRFLKRQRTSSRETWVTDEVSPDGLTTKTDRHYIQVADILRRVGYARSDYKTAMKQETLAQYADSMEKENPDMVNIPDWLVYGADEFINIKKMPIGQVRDIQGAIRNIKKMARTGQNANGFTALNDRGLGATVWDMVEQADNNVQDVLVDKIEKKETGFWEKFRAGLIKPSQLFLKLDAYKDFGIWHNVMYQPLSDAQNLKSQLQRKVYDALEQAYISEGISKEQRLKDSTQKIYIPEWRQSVTKQALRTMLLNMGSESNRDRLFSKPPVGLEFLEDSWKKSEPEVTKLLTRYLEPRDFRLAQKIWDAVNILYEPYTNMVQKMTGSPLEKVDPRPISFTMPDGKLIQLRGGYYPLKQDARASKQAELNAEKALADNYLGVMPYPNSGASKSRAKSAQYSVDLDFSNIFSHINDVSHDIAFRPVMHDINKLMRQDIIVQKLRQKLGEANYRAINQWQRSVARGKDPVVEDWLNDLVPFVRTATVIKNLLFRPSVVIQNFANPTLYGDSVEGFSDRDAAEAYLKYGWNEYIPHALTGSKRAQEIRDWVYEKSPMMRDKMDAPDYSIQELRNYGYKNKLMKSENEAVQKAGIKLAITHENIVEFGSKILAATDQLSDIPMFRGAYFKAIAEGKSESEAVRFAETVIERSTGTGRRIDTSLMQRGSSVQKLMTMFMTFLNTQYNRWAMERGIYLQEKDAARLMRFVAVRYLMFGALSAFLSFKWPDDDEGWGGFLAKEILEWPLGMVPIGGAIAKTMLDSLMGFRTYSYGITPVERNIEEAIKFVPAIKKAWANNDFGLDLWEKASGIGSFVLQYPDQFNDWFWNAYDIMTGNMKPEFSDLVRRRPRKER